MENFEKVYYESPAFWEEGMLEDENNKIRIETTAKLVPADVKTLADIGCGNGVFLNYLSNYRPELILIGIDRSSTALSYVKTNKKLGEIDSLPFDNNSFDCVTCLEVIEHLPIEV